VTTGSPQRRRLHELIDAMRDAFHGYACTTDLQEAAMHLRRRRMQAFEDAYDEAMKLLQTDDEGL